MRNMILASAAALAFTAAPAMADDHMDGDGYMWTDEQKVMYEGWPADRQSAYDAWPADVQEYYWTLTPAQTNGWWVLTDAQRVRIYEMTPEARAQAWTQISSQMSATPATSTATTSSATTTSTSSATATQPRFVSRAVTAPMPAGYTATTSGTELPVCKPNQQDGCINSWEKNRTGTRPLDYWPGRPASEIEGPIPAEDPDM